MTTFPLTTSSEFRGVLEAAASVPRSQAPASGLDRWWHALGGVGVRLVRRRGRYLARAQQVLAHAPTYLDLPDAELRAAAEELRSRFRRSRRTADDELRGLALICEVAARRIGQRPFAVQIAGALAISEGCIAEMATGEGKTLTAALAASLAGWRGRGCHLITVNDYLAARDAEWMRPVFESCGLRVGCVTSEARLLERQAAHACDVTYTTNKEVAADFLRDRLALGDVASAPAAFGRAIRTRTRVARDIVLRGLDTAIVDEADSILIDEAVTPLIIAGSAPNAQGEQAYRVASQVASEFARETHYSVDRGAHEIRLTQAGRRLCRARGELFAGVIRGDRRREELIVQALVARELYQRGAQYVVSDQKVAIVDEFTGRLMPDRTWRDGLHQAVEAKEGLPINPPTDTLARISFQRFFRLYRRLSGMTGTGWEARSELWRNYDLPVVRIPTNRPIRRVVRRDQVLVRMEGKWSACTKVVVDAHARGQPVLVGCRTVRESNELSRRLTAQGVDHRVLNAEKVAEEAAIVERAGEVGAVTIATNMAGRGTDIRLGREVSGMGGLLVVATARHDSRRVDRQLHGRAGRQGDPGLALTVISLEDELFRANAHRLARAIAAVCPSAQVPMPIGQLLTRWAQHLASKRARRRRRSVLLADNWLDESLGFAGRAP